MAIFPGNISQYLEHMNAFGLNTDQARAIRLLFQPVLVIWALWSTGAWQAWRESRKAVQNQANQPVVAANNDPTKLIQVGFINAEIKGFNGNYREALSSVNTLVNHLRENAQVEQVTVLQEPVNVSSLANLQGSTTDENATTESTPAIFKLKIVLKPVNTGAS